MLTIFQRHLSVCPHTSRRYRCCQCPTHVGGLLGQEYVRESLNLTVCGVAQGRVRGREASGQFGIIRNEIPTVKEAIAKHVSADTEARKLKAETVKDGTLR